MDNDTMEPVDLGLKRMMLTSNGFRVGKVRKDGTVRAFRRVLSLTYGLTFEFEVILAPGNRSVLNGLTVQTGATSKLTGTLEKVVTAAVSVAHAAM